jgi:surface polysaccharide O-acyltransferase-like enzyme
VGVVDALARFSLPLFFIISGTLLLANPPKEGDTTKRLARVAALILFWSVAFLVFLSFRTSLVVEDLVKLFLRGEGYYHLWYLWALIPLYLLVPLIHKGLERYSLGVVLGGVIVLGSLGSSIESFAISYHIFVHPLFKGVIYLFYFVLGGILVRQPLSKLGGGGFLIIGVGGVLIELLGSGSINQALVAIRFSSPFVALMGVGVVTLFYHFGNNRQSRNHFEKNLNFQLLYLCRVC